MASPDETRLVKSARYDSLQNSPNINHLSADVEGGHAAKYNRSSSVGPGMTASSLNPLQRSRRALYVNLPFLSMYGLQHRERSLAESLSEHSLNDLDIEGQAEDMAEATKEKIVVTGPLISAVLAAVLLEFLVGFNIGVMNAPESVVFPGHTTTEWATAVSVFAIGGPFGAMLAGTVSNEKGRRAAVTVNTWLYILGGVLFALAPSIMWLILARFLVGFACGFSSVVVPIYLGELAPPTLRGTLGTMTQFALVLGILGSNVIAFPLSNAKGWRYMFALTPMLAAVDLVCLPLLLESPSMYGLQHRERSLAESLSEHSLNDLDVEGQAEDMAEATKEKIVVTGPLISAVLAAVLLEFLVGFNIGVMNAPESVVFPGHTTTEWATAVSVFAIGGPFGAMLAGTVSNEKGRRAAVTVNTWLYILGGVLFALAPSIMWLILARFLVGFACGFSSVVVPIYLGELAPPTLRGTLGTMTQFALVLGILGSNVIAFPLSNAKGWRYMFALTPMLAAVDLVCLPLLLESPRWLLARDQNSMEARVAIKKLRGFTSDDDVQMEIQHILEASNAQKTGHDSANSKGAMTDLFSDPRQRLLVISFVILHAAQQLTGINAIFYYSNSFFEGIIDNPLVGTTLVGAINVVATYVALKLMDTTGRVPLMLCSVGGMLASSMVVTLALVGFLPNIVAVFGVMAFVTFFEIGLGPIPWLIVAEMFDAKYVSAAMSVACQVNWASNFVVGIGWPLVHQAMGPYSFATFGTILLATFIFTLLYLPETAGRSVAEVQHAANEPRRCINCCGGVADESSRDPRQYVVVDGVDQL